VAVRRRVDVEWRVGIISPDGEMVHLNEKSSEYFQR